jgi:hypothetical protein
MGINTPKVRTTPMLSRKQIPILFPNQRFKMSILATSLSSCHHVFFLHFIGTHPVFARRSNIQTSQIMGNSKSKPSSRSSSPDNSKPKGRRHRLTDHQKATEKVHGIMRRKGERNSKNYGLWVNNDLVSPDHKNYKRATDLPPLGSKGRGRKAASKSSYSTGSGSYAQSGGGGGGAGRGTTGGAGFTQPGGGFTGASYRPTGGGGVVSIPGGPPRSRGSV